MIDLFFVLHIYESLKSTLMSQFFSDIDEPAKEATKKDTAQREFSDEEEIFNKKEVRVQAVRLEILQAEESLSNKSVDRVLRLLQKNQKFLSKDMHFVKKFLDNVLVAKKISQTVKSKCREFLSKFFETDTQILKAGALRKKATLSEELSVIMNLKNFATKCKRIDGLLERTTSETEKFKVLVSKMLIYINNLENCNMQSVYSLTCQISDIYDRNDTLVFEDVDMKRLFVHQIGTYLDGLLRVIVEDTYSLLEKISGVLCKYDESMVSKKMLSFKYFLLGEYVENQDCDFRLLYLTKNQKNYEALTYFAENMSYLLESEERPVLVALYEFGHWCFTAGEYNASFKALQRCYYSGFEDCESRLLILCCILNRDIVGEEFFCYFLEQLSALEKNPMLLESGIKKKEILRAFLLLSCYDYMGCESILQKIEPNIRCTDYLKGYVLESIKKLQKVHKSRDKVSL